MTRDFATGMVVSAVLHAGAAVFGQFLHRDAPVPPPNPVDDPEWLRFELRQDLQPQDPMSDDFSVIPYQKIAMILPTQPDLPSPAQDLDFGQPVQLAPDVRFPIHPGNISVPYGPFGPGSNGILDPSLLDVVPAPLVTPLPEYPAAMRKSGVDGRVVIRFIVDADGTVRAPRVVESSQREFERKPLEAVSKWRFRPGRKSGQAVATWMEVPLLFSIR